MKLDWDNMKPLEKLVIVLIGFWCIVTIMVDWLHDEF
jgi:hypothetical protein